MDQVTQQNAALVEEAAAASQSMQHQADQLVQAVSRFRLGADVAEPVTGQHAQAGRRERHHQPAMRVGFKR